MCKYKKEHKYEVCGNIKLGFSPGKKTEGDYTVKWSFNGQQDQQFTDKDLFNKLSSEVKSKKEALNFIKCFYTYENIKFNTECINLTINDVQEIVDYVRNLSLSDNLRLCLACMFFRCDIDNINYPCTKYNGCIRHFVQILMLFGYKFDIAEFKCEKLNIDEKNDNDISNIISDIGYPTNKHNITTADFKNIYIDLGETLQKMFKN